MKYLAIDYGKRRIGLATGELMARPLLTIENKGFESVLKRIQQVVEEEEIDKIVIGLPILPSGEKPQLAKEIEDFGAKIADTTNLEVYYEPEQYSSVQAESELRAAGLKIDKKQGNLDKISAAIILEQHLNSKAK